MSEQDRSTVLRKNLPSAKIVKIEFNANLYLLGFSHFITFKECRKMLFSERK